MILVDSTVWIDFFNGRITPQTDYLGDNITNQPILVGDIILGEVLQGFQNDTHFEKALLALGKFQQVSLITPELAVQSARNYRVLRSMGITVRKTIDCFIATYCLVNRHDLLHSDKDFDAFEQYMGLQVIHPEYSGR
jgi:predicted nucleic acid-binding protein